MYIHDATEIAYKNGYADALKDVQELLKVGQQLSDAIKRVYVTEEKFTRALEQCKR